MPRGHIRSGAVSAALLLSTACALFGPDQVTGTWANALAVVVAANDSVAFQFQCLRVTIDPGVVPADGSFALRGNFGGLNRHGPVTITGTVSASTIAFDMRPGRSPVDSVDHFTVMRNAPPPDWYPTDPLPCAD